MAFLEIQSLRTLSVPIVVQNFDLAVERGEFISLLGPSGCGKTTVLRMVAGFETPTSGSIQVEGKEITGLRPNQRKVGMVFQAYALFPNMPVRENVAFGLRVGGKSPTEIAQRVDEMLKMIKPPHRRRPLSLSALRRAAAARGAGPRDRGEAAASAAGRAAVGARREDPRTPAGGDPQSQRALGITTIFVTDDQEEALSMSDRIVVMNEGRAEQIGTPSKSTTGRDGIRRHLRGHVNILKARSWMPPADGLPWTVRKSPRPPASPTATPAKPAPWRRAARRRSSRIGRAI